MILPVIAPKIKYVDINLTKHVQELYAEHCKMLTKKKYVRIWRHTMIMDFKTQQRQHFPQIDL